MIKKLNTFLCTQINKLLIHLRGVYLKWGLNSYTTGELYTGGLMKGSRLIVGNNVVIGEEVRLKAMPGAKIHIKDGVRIGFRTVITAYENIVIGEDTLISPDVFITDHDHGIKKGRPFKYQKMTVEPVYISKNVWVGTKSVILKGAVIMRNSVIGAGSVVKYCVPWCSLVAGVPAKIIKVIK